MVTGGPPGSMSVAERGATRDGGLTLFGQAIMRRIKQLQADDPKLTLERIAIESGMSRQHLWRALRAKTRFSPFEVAQLARRLQIDPDIATAAYTAIDVDTWTVDEMVEFLKSSLPGDSREPFSELSLAELTELRSKANAMVQAKRLRTHAGDLIAQMPNGEWYIIEAKGGGRLGEARQVGGVYRTYSLPRELAVLAEEFKLEALRAGADEQERAFIDSVLGSPEAIFRLSGFHDTPLSPEQRRSELESVIAMLRQWLRQHMLQRGASFAE